MTLENSQKDCQTQTPKRIKVKKKHVKTRKRKPRSKAREIGKFTSASQNLNIVEESNPASQSATTGTVQMAAPLAPPIDENGNPIGKQDSGSSTAAEQEQLENIKRMAGKQFQNKLECQQKLENLKQDLFDLRRFFNMLRPSDLSEISSYVNPPPSLKFVMKLVCLVLNIPPDVTGYDQNGHKILEFWRPVKNFLHSWAHNIRAFNFENLNLSPKIIKMIPKSYFDSPKKIRLISSAAESLTRWLGVAAKNWRLKNKVEKAEIELKAAEAELKLALDQFKDAEDTDNKTK